MCTPQFPKLSIIAYMSDEGFLMQDSAESLESLEIGRDEEFLVDSSSEEIESIEDYFEDAMSSNVSQRLTIIQDDCGASPCDFLFAESELSDQAIGE